MSYGYRNRRLQSDPIYRQSGSERRYYFGVLHAAGWVHSRRLRVG
jgi:hypothetical protein